MKGRFIHLTIFLVRKVDVYTLTISWFDNSRCRHCNFLSSKSRIIHLNIFLVRKGGLYILVFFYSKSRLKHFNISLGSERATYTPFYFLGLKRRLLHLNTFLFRNDLYTLIFFGLKIRHIHRNLFKIQSKTFFIQNTSQHLQKRNSSMQFFSFFLSWKNRRLFASEIRLFFVRRQKRLNSFCLFFFLPKALVNDKKIIDRQLKKMRVLRKEHSSSPDHL